jgi:hypothetical protein
MAVFVRDCPYCPATNSSFTIHWQGKIGNLWRVGATCGACGDFIVARVSGGNPNNSPQNTTGNINAMGYQVGETWPSREAPVAPPHTPGPTASRFTDGEFNFQNGRWNAAVGMYRAALDLATKDLQAQGATFFARLQWLNQNGRVTADIKDWADHVRVEGNGALHDPDDFSETDAKALRHFTTMFLRYVFEMPGLVTDFRNNPSP